MVDRTVGEVLADALPPYDALVELGEEIEDEWSYVNDLAETWRMRLGVVTEARGAEIVPAAAVDAIEVVGEEAARIRDPHRAIDWLSTYPQVVLLALGEQP